MKQDEFPKNFFILNAYFIFLFIYVHMYLINFESLLLWSNNCTYARPKFWLLNATLSPLPSILSVSEVARWSFRSVTRAVIRKEGWGTDHMTYLRCQTVSFTTYLILDRSTLLLLEWMYYSETWEFQTVLHILHIKKTHHETFIFCEMQSNCYNKKNTHQIYTFLLRWTIIIIIHVNDCKFGSPYTSLRFKSNN